MIEGDFPRTHLFQHHLSCLDNRAIGIGSSTCPRESKLVRFAANELDLLWHTWFNSRLEPDVLGTPFSNMVAGTISLALTPILETPSLGLDCKDCMCISWVPGITIHAATMVC